MNSYGNNFKITIFGESHSEYVGVAIDGVTPGIDISEKDFINDIQRRKSGALGTTPRIEEDVPEIICGVNEGRSTGSPLVVLFKNNNVCSADYEHFREVPRPGHADLVSSVKFNYFNDMRGGGEFSGRMTLPLAVAGVVAKKMIAPISISASLIQAGGIDLKGKPEDNPKFCELLKKTIMEGDSIGGIVECVCNNVPIGIGNPFFDSMESQISHLVFSIPGVRGIEFGDGFAASSMKGSVHNDPYIDKYGHTYKNGAGGINGGIANGNPIIFRVAFKPTSSIRVKQCSFNFITETMEEFSISGRHDACFALRTPVIVESAAACVLCDNLSIRQ